MDRQEALATVGLPDPGGRPTVQRAQAQEWYTLARQLDEHSDRVTALIAGSTDSGRWRSDSAKALYRHTQTLAQASKDMAEIAYDVGQHVDEHAERHDVVLKILEELAIQIAAMLAFMAASALVPPLLAWAKAQLVLLAVNAGRLLRLIITALHWLVQLLVRARTLIQKLSRLTFRNGRFSIGYGKLLYEGSRDFLVDLVTNATTFRIQGRPLDAGDLFLSAGVSFGVGGAIGGIGGTGFKRARAPDGTILRQSDGLPKFVSIENQYKGLIDSVGRRPPQAAAPPLPGGPPQPRALDRLTQAEANARRWGIQTGNAAEGDRLAADVVAADLAGNQATFDVAASRFTAWDQLQAAREHVSRAVSRPDQWRHTWRNNAWREGFGKPKTWHHIVLNDGVKDTLKGFASEAIKTRIDVARGRKTMDDVWKEALLAGAFASVRGMIKASVSNRWFPSESIEEMLWRISTKGLDNVARELIAEHSF